MGFVLRTEPFADADLSVDEFLGGRVRLLQPLSGYRAGVDPVLLAATIPAKAGNRVLELGCGAAPGLCCLGSRVPGLELHGLEVQAGYADLAVRNLVENGMQHRVWQSDLRDIPQELRQISFDHVFANPPYFQAEMRKAAQDGGREVALAGETSLSDWVALAARRSKPGGSVTFIQRAERLPELLAAFQDGLGSIELWPLVPRQGRAPRLVLLRGRKGGKTPFRFHPSQVLHAGARHEQDAENYVALIRSVLRDGAALPFPD